MPSCFRLMPGEEEDVMARMPVPAAPYTMLMAASSDSACTNTRPCLGILLFGNLLGTLATPFRYGFRAVGNAFGGFADYVTEFNSLRKENEQMADRIAELEKEVAHAKVLEGENNGTLVHN